MLPNLIIIGAGKCGTTSLHAYLDQHPQIAMSQVKELHYFDRPDWQERRGWYEDQFDGSSPVRGESTPVYSAWPAIPDVPERMQALIPDAKLVYLVRDPIERIMSSYIQMIENGDPRSFEAWMQTAEEPDNRLVCQSRYATQIDRFLEHFGRDQLLVLDQRDLRTRRDEVLEEVFGFLGVDDSFAALDLAAEHNTRADKRRMRGLDRDQFYRAVKLGRRILPQRVRRALQGPVERAVYTRIDERPVLDAPTRARLEAILRPEARRLRELTGLPLAGWSV